MSYQQRAIKDVADERRRQQASEGYEPEHDDEQVRGELAYAAACYALSGARHPERVSGIWPWQPGAFKPKSRREDLVRAGALILAEIERLDRASEVDPTHTVTGNAAGGHSPHDPKNADISGG